MGWNMDYKPLTTGKWPSLLYRKQIPQRVTQKMIKSEIWKWWRKHHRSSIPDIVFYFLGQLYKTFLDCKGVLLNHVNNNYRCQFLYGIPKAVIFMGVGTSLPTPKINSLSAPKIDSLSTPLYWHRQHDNINNKNKINSSLQIDGTSPWVELLPELNYWYKGTPNAK